MKPKNKHHSEIIPLEEQKMIADAHENHEEHENHETHEHHAVAVTNNTAKSSPESQPAQQEKVMSEQINIQSSPAPDKNGSTEGIDQQEAPSENDNTQTQQQEETINKELEQIWAEGSEHLLKENKK